MFTKRFLRQNTVTLSIIVFLCLLGLVHFTKPAFIYNEDGGFRPFGLGYRHKTVIPIWVASIVLAVLAYLFVHVLAQRTGHTYSAAIDAL